MRLFLMFLVLTLLQSPVNANFETGLSQQYLSAASLHAQCATNLDSPNYILQQSKCSSYVIGVVDAMNSVNEALELPAPYCLPKRINADSLVNVVRIFLIENPDERAFSAASVVGTALILRFPCQSTRGE